MKNYFVHTHGLCESNHIGDGTRIEAFAHVLAGAKIGSNSRIGDHVYVENDVVIGDRVTIKGGVQLWDGLRIEDDVFVGPNTTFTNESFPVAEGHQKKFATTVVEAGASIGANATILPGVRIGRRAIVGAGSVITQDVPPFSKVVGNPAHIIGYENTEVANNESIPKASSPDKFVSVVNGVKLISLPSHKDMRGALTVADFGQGFPFEPKRVFLVSQVPSAKVRGEHAHKRCQQLLLCVSGSINAIVDDGKSREMHVLNNPNVALYMPAMTWGTQFNYSPDAVLLVFASETYDADDYIRDYNEFRELTRLNSGI